MAVSSLTGSLPSVLCVTLLSYYKSLSLLFGKNPVNIVYAVNMAAPAAGLLKLSSADIHLCRDV